MPQQPNATTYKDAAIIAENEKWFNIWRLLPKIITIVFALACFVLGIVFVNATDGISILIFWGGGAVYCALNYFFLKLVMSYKVLHIYYLKKLSSNNANVASKVNVASQPSAAAASKPKDVLPTI